MGAALGAGPSLAPLLIGLGRLLDGHIHGLLLCLQTPLKLLVDMVVGGLLKEEILYLLPELGVGGQHLVKVDSDLRGGCASNQVSHNMLWTGWSWEDVRVLLLPTECQQHTAQPSNNDVSPSSLWRQSHL